MSCVHLEATDGSGRFALPNGETMIGRGPFLGVSDKRVSRSHAVLEVVDNRLRIKPVHVNPCFYQVKGERTFVPLEKDEWCWLRPGDCFSLLPDKYTFRVIAEEEETLRNEALHQDTGLSDSPPCSSSASEIKEKPISVGDTSKQSILCTVHESQEEAASTSAVYIEVNEKAGSTQRKRVLPDWMLKGDLKIKSLLVPLSKPGTKKRIGTEQNVVMSYSGENSKGKKALSKRNVPEDVEEECLKKKRNQLEVLSTTSSKGNIPMEDSDCHLKRPVLSDDDDDDDDDDDMEVQNNDFSQVTKKEQKRGCENDHNNTGVGSQSFKPSKPSNFNRADEEIPDQSLVEDVSYSEADSPQAASNKRTLCMYGEHCYRKNPAHFQEFCHPGDSDYCDAENGSQDDKPECPYGTDCYRKNPQHKLEYKHTKPPEGGGRRLRRRPAKKGKGALDDDNGEPNEYDLDDSFIDDDEEEDFDNTDEDSDWMPDTEDRDSEDVKTLLKEANKFVKGNH